MQPYRVQKERQNILREICRYYKRVLRIVCVSPARGYIFVSKLRHKPYLLLSMRANRYAANTASEHISANNEAIAAPDIPISNPNINSPFIGMFTSTAVKAAMFSGFVCVMPTKNERKARNGKRITSKKFYPYRQPIL